MAETLVRQATGLRTFPNHLAAKPGSLLLAQNCILTRDGVISCRRGFQRWGAVSPSAWFEYRFKALVLDGQTMKYNSSDDIWTSWPGVYDPPPGVRMRGKEIDEKFFFLTALGPYVNESPTGTPRRAGIPKGLDLQGVLTGTGGSWHGPDSQVGYRIVFGKGTLPPGTPSHQAIITNPITSVTLTKSGTIITVAHIAHGFATGDLIEILAPVDLTYLAGQKTIIVTGANTYTYDNLSIPSGASTTAQAGKGYDIALTATIPQGVESGWWWEVYRSTRSAHATDIPFDIHRRIAKRDISAADISNGYVQWTDTFDDTHFSVNLYTNEGSEGATQGNDPPPFAKFIVSFRGHTIYLNIRHPHPLELKLEDLDGIVIGDTITITVGGLAKVYSFAAAENLAARQFQLFTESGEGTMAVAVRKTALSLAKVINRDSGSQVYAFYASSGEDPPGKLVLERRTLEDSSFSLTSTVGTKWEPVLPISGTSVSSKSLAAPHRIAISKYQKPEAVPTVNTKELSLPGFEITGGAVLREALLVFGQAGIQEMTGESDGLAGRDFTVREVAPGRLLIQPDTLVVLDNLAMGWFDQGICRVNSTGISIVSNDIDDILTKITSFTNFDTSVFAIANEDFGEYTLWVPESGSDPFPRLGYVYNSTNLTWAGPWKKKVKSGIALRGDARLYLTHAVDSFALRERRSFTENDLIDEDIAITVTAVGTTTVDGVLVSTATVTYTYAGEHLTDGWMFTKGIDRVWVENVESLGSGNYKLTFSREILGLTTGAATLTIPIEQRVEWMDDPAGNAAMSKHFNAAQIYFEGPSPLRNRVAFLSDTVGSESDLIDVNHETDGGWGSDWGAVWGDPEPNLSVPVRVEVPRDHKEGRTLRTIYVHKRAREIVNILQLALEIQLGSEITTKAPR